MRTFLLGGLSFDDLLALQRRLVYEVGGERDTAALILCDQPSGITIGREGSTLHVKPDQDALANRYWPIRWVSRGGGVMLHQPGQVTCYPVFALDRLNQTPAGYLAQLQGIVIDLLHEFGVAGIADPDTTAVRVKDRRVAHIGIAVRGWVSSFGLVINVDPDLDPFRDVCCDGDREPMTSLQREAPAMRVRIAAVRQRLVELFAARFRIDRVSLFHRRPETFTPITTYATPTTTR